ncbi:MULTISPECIES: alanine racemase [Atopobiaceae]|uniref:Alanine racemase n=1 Tax=Parafannyhessea umbonata TaxID=604330 RepID=A0A1H9R2E1_9ACTN|nr:MULTISPECIES: alanine racemase [Atopobiaceae]SEH63233.1 alanine racemase [Parafannyhessea umbonata]SER66872.1 alanine racemase [Parafannyhessea umbonata]SJZ84110.1 alanine racemase [Olsenella sp. KH1P3]
MPTVKYPKNRWAWVEVDLNAIRKNTRAFKAQIERGTKMMCAVKADAYGHGAVECAKTMHSAGADQFAVATVDEGIELRKGGVTQPILMLNESPLEGIDDLLAYDIMPAIYTTEFAYAYGERAVALDKVGKYHLAVDTGMTRIGVLPEDAVEFRHSIDFHRGLECAGTFTHFATADVIGDWDFKQQARRFADTVGALRQAGFETGLVHCDNTPGTLLHPEFHYDMCRVGIGLYGLQAAETTAPRIALTPAMSVRARVTRVINPAVGEGVGYGLTYRVPKPNIQIATVPVGYADGLSRVLSNNMDVICNGTRARQVGRICMDQFMFAVDVNSIRAYHPARSVERGDVVTIIGRDGDEEITADEMAARRNTINYEVVCNFSQRLDRVFV